MNSVPILRRAALAGLVLPLLALTARADAPAPERSQARYEQNFLSDMIDHHQEGVALAELAATRATHPELRSLAALIRTSQAAQIESMRKWLAAWYDVEYPAESEARATRRVAALAALSGVAFEREFLVEMALHHAEALEAAGKGLLRAYHADLIELTRDTLSVQADELALFRIWLNQWYDVIQVTPADRGGGAMAADNGDSTPVTSGSLPPTTTTPSVTTPPSATAPSVVTTPAIPDSVATPPAQKAPAVTTDPVGTQN